jgi:membrane-bound lytic murein transglycosylase D
MDSLMSIKRALPIASKTHVVRSGESISAVARKYGVTVNEIKKWNKLKSAKLKRGQRLKVSPPYTAQVEQSVSSSGGNTEIKPAEESKTNTQASEEKSEQASESATPTETSKTTTKEKKTPGVSTYKVRPGDTLWKVAVSHGMTLAEIRKLNGFTSKTVLRTGMKIKVKTK